MISDGGHDTSACQIWGHFFHFSQYNTLKAHIWPVSLSQNLTQAMITHFTTLKFNLGHDELKGVTIVSGLAVNTTLHYTLTL